MYNEGVDIIALDATSRIRPDGKTIEEVFPEIRKQYKDQLFMADCSTYEEAILAEKLGFDYIGTTLNGYTDYTKGSNLPNFELLERIVNTNSLRQVTLTTHSDITLLCGANEGPLQGGSLTAKISQLYLLDVLYAEYFKRTDKQSITNKDKTAQSVIDKMV